DSILFVEASLRGISTIQNVISRKISRLADYDGTKEKHCFFRDSESYDSKCGPLEYPVFYLWVVADLVNNVLNSWNADVIYDLFNPDQANLILWMPLPSTPQPDLIVWRGDMTGNYSIKLGNNVLMRGLASTHSSYPTMPPSSLSGLYNKIWNANVPSKVRITVWRYSETASHLISTCAFSRRIFSTLNITLPQVVHDRATFNLPSFIIFIKSYMDDMDTLPPMACSPVLSLEEKWFPPCPGIMKVNFDAAFDSATSSSFFGIIFRDSAGDVLAAGCFSHPLVLDSFEAEALACYQALVLAHDLSYRRIVIEGDSLSVIKKVQNFSEDRSVIGMLIKDIKRKMGNFDSTTAPFCPRACNKPAHFLAHLGRSLPTPCIWTECSTPS
ncbi:hypothetical protein V6N13_106386, partial [Hibiscus sabdariffa]